MSNGNFIVTYRYTITMQDRKATYNQAISKWTDQQHIDDIYYGKNLLAVSPIAEFENSYLTQIQLDVEPSRPKSFRGTYDAFKFATNFIKNYPDFYVNYTGRFGFHIYSKFVVRTEKMESSKLRHLLLDPLNLNTSLVDEVASIRRMPTIRIGKRTDMNSIATPIYTDKFEYIEKLRTYDDFSEIMSKRSLINFIRNELFPVDNEIDYKSYLHKMKKVINY